MSAIRVPHRGQLGQASTAGGVAVIVAMFTSHENWRGHNESLSHRQPMFVVLFSADDGSCYAPFITMASRMYDKTAGLSGRSVASLAAVHQFDPCGGQS